MTRKELLLCPICQKPMDRQSGYFPFCSDRCKLVDLGNWAGGKYRVIGEKVDQKNNDEEIDG